MNRRTDAYGGSLDNRIRFTLEMFEEIRRQVGPDYIVGIRMSARRDARGRHEPEESLEIAVRHARSGLIDFINVIGADATTDLGISKLIPTMGQRTGPYLGHARAIRAATGLPVFHATRITDLSTARHAVAEGMVDMVGMTRAHIADPHIVAKLHARRGGPDPPLRRRRLLHRPDLCRRRRAVRAQPGHRPRADHAARDPTPATGRSGGWS